MKPATEQTRAESLLIDLAALYMEGNPFLGHYAWHWEEERWHEMLVCALVSSGATPEQARSAVHIFNEFQMADPISIAEANEDDTQLIRKVLVRLGLPDNHADAAVSVLNQTAKTCLVQWSGKPQLFLREMAQRCVEALTAHFVACGMGATQAEMLSTLWLQNVSNAPILASKSAAVMAFCKEAGIDARELIEAADTVGLNVAILDELMLMRQQQPDDLPEEGEQTGSAGERNT